jgi:GT2 family glycosyltransferase
MSLPPSMAKPDVSVVMPVFNKLELTRVCLESIEAEGAEASFEVLVVDNGSTDGSRKWLTDQQNQGRLRLIASPDNLGFSRGCNIGAAAARGRHILFLNNDMKVLPGWLDPMVSTLDRDAQVGVVGAKLLFSDNTIQHAGVALVEFQSPEGKLLGGVHLSHHKPVNTPGTTEPQYQQIVTGACLMIRSQLFRELGGFDEAFWNGNEDVDLCLRAGQRGWKVVYRPESMIYHFESQSGPERWSQTRHNVERLNNLWQGNALPDFTSTSDRKVTATENMDIRTYVSPRLVLPRPENRRGNQAVVSVVVLTWNALDYTRKCVASLLKHTHRRHELILVDNGSDQDTLDYLTKLEAEQPGVKVIFNGKNLGFAAGNNVGIAAAQGDYVCLLNSDTVVTAGWLEALLSPAEKSARVGLVGPVTNRISGAQQLASVGYDEDTLEGLDDFAAGRSAAEAGKSQGALMIVGFCLLMKKRLIERIGGLDEGFGQGNYEDNDYCLRAMLAGFNSVVAFDSFVHHFGSRSFVAGQVDYAAQISEKFAIFGRKWNLKTGARSTAELDLNKLLHVGYLAPLHFHPLPAAAGVRVHPLADWELDRWLRLGEALFEKGCLHDAERVFRAVLAGRPDSLRGANDLACTLWKLQGPDQLAEAVTILEDVLRQDPANEDASWNLQEISAVAN